MIGSVDRSVSQHQSTAVIDHGWRHSVKRTKKYGTRRPPPPSISAVWVQCQALARLLKSSAPNIKFLKRKQNGLQLVSFIIKQRGTFYVVIKNGEKSTFCCDVKIRNGKKKTEKDKHINNANLSLKSIYSFARRKVTRCYFTCLLFKYLTKSNYSIRFSHNT